MKYRLYAIYKSAKLTIDKIAVFTFIIRFGVLVELIIATFAVKNLKAFIVLFHHRFVMSWTPTNNSTLF